MKAIIIGGGIIGLTSAYYLQKSGWQVTIIDKTDLSDTCSVGNMGMIVPSHFVPLASPGIITQGLKWMLDNKSPFYIKPSLNKKLLSWGFHFLKSATAKKVKQAARPLLDLHLYSKSLYEKMNTGEGLDMSLEKKGIMMYYKTEKTGEEEIHLAEKAKAMGLDVACLSSAEAQLLEPNIRLDVLGAVHYRCDAHLYPDLLIRSLIKHLEQNGVEIISQTAVTDLEIHQHKVSKVITNKGTFQADLVVMATGAWLPELAKKLNIKIPLMPGKGYSFTMQNDEQRLNIPAIFCEARSVITPMNNYLRIGGTMEIAPVNNKINLNRVQGIVKSIGNYMPGLPVQMPEEKDIWFGFRPCSPDGLPYIGKHKKMDNLILAGGHAMMGLSLGPATGKIVADLANEQAPLLDLRLFAPDRFDS